LEAGSAHDEGVKEDRVDEVQGRLDQAQRRGHVGVVEVGAQGVLVALEGVDQPDHIREDVLLVSVPGPSQRRTSFRIVVRETYPCDENPEKTSEREECAGGGNCLALGEEHLDGRAEEHKVDPCEERTDERTNETDRLAREDGGRVTMGKRTVEERLDGERDELGEGKVDGHIVRLSWDGFVSLGGILSTVALLLRLLRMGTEDPGMGFEPSVTYRGEEGVGGVGRWGGRAFAKIFVGWVFRHGRVLGGGDSPRPIIADWWCQKERCGRRSSLLHNR